MEFSDYKIHIVASNNFKDKLVAYIEELHNVSELIDKKEDAYLILKAKFEKEIERLRAVDRPIPKPGSGKATFTFAANEKIQNLRPFIDEFWQKILGTSFSSSLISNESDLTSWEHYLTGGKNELIEKVKNEYGIDIKKIYDLPIHEVLATIKNAASKKQD